jgi:protein-S-isoprenylcysteine O-methyltransferase Ste14
VNLQAWGKTAQKIRVPAGTVLGLAFLLMTHPTARLLWIGGAVALAGALLRIWAAGHIEKGRVLTRGGPYRWTRNPLYLGSLLMATGVIVAGGVYWLLIALAVVFSAVYYPVMKAEEQELFAGFGQEYRDYCGEAPFFFPRVWASGRASSTFLWSRVIRNGEHRTLLGLLLIGAFLFWRST